MVLCQKAFDLSYSSGLSAYNNFIANMTIYGGLMALNQALIPFYQV
jgi:hypothetical protein